MFMSDISRFLEQDDSSGISGGGLPSRNQVPLEDTWDLTQLYASDEIWEEAFSQWEKKIPQYAEFRGKLADVDTLIAFLKFDLDFSREGEKVGAYAFLKTTQDVANSKYQEMRSRVMAAASRASQASSFMRPELLAIPEATWNAMLADPRLAPYQLMLERIARFRPHTLSEPEEKLLAMMSEMAASPRQIFGQLNNADLRFGTVKDENGNDVELTNGNFTVFLHSPDRNIRKNAFHQFYTAYDGHQNTFAATLEASVQRDNFFSKARNFENPLDAAMFIEEIPRGVYDNLIAGVHDALPTLYRYFEIRRRKMNIDDIHFYDTYVPIQSDIKTHHTWEQAVDLIIEALRPVGPEYCQILHDGLLMHRWSDRYENRGKQSGAFSAGTFDGLPYIMMNYKPDIIESVYTLAHEAGHSMHSWYSSHNQPFQYYDYPIFLAEIASTFNEQLLTRYLLKTADSDRQRAWLLNRQIDAIRATIFRQTMFAEFEKVIHDALLAGQPLTVDRFRGVYGELLKQYFGPNFVIDEELSLECFRIPHFYRAFYVYKYATGLAAAIALSERVVHGGEQERRDYFSFLKAGCSRLPIDILKGAGVDMTKPDAVQSAMKLFAENVEELEQLI